MHATLTSLLSATGRRGGVASAVSNLISSHDFRANSTGPMLTNTGFAFSRASAATVEDYAGDIWDAAANELRVQGARRVDHADGIDYGFGALGVQYFSTDGGGTPLGSTIKGFASEVEQTNIVRSNCDLTTAAWTRRGALSTGGITTGSDQQMGGTYSAIRGMTGPGSADVYQVVSGLTATDRYEPKFRIRRMNSSTGVLSISNPNSGTDGSWQINLASLTNNVATTIDRYHPAVTVSYEHVVSTGGSTGTHLYRETGASALDFDISLITTIKDTEPSVSFIRNTSTSAAATRSGDLLVQTITALSNSVTLLVSAETLRDADPSSGSGLASAHLAAAGETTYSDIRPISAASSTQLASVESIWLNNADLTKGTHKYGLAIGPGSQSLTTDAASSSATDATGLPAAMDRLQFGGTNGVWYYALGGYVIAWEAYNTRLSDADVATKLAAMS